FQRDLLRALQARQDLDALERRDAGLDGDDVVEVLPVVGEPDVLAAPFEPLLRLGDLLRLEGVLEAIDDRLALATLERLARDRDGLLLLLAEDLDVRAHAGAIDVAELVERDLDGEDLDLVEELRGWRDEAHLAREVLLRIRVERDAHRLADL